jgi:hypothetical protein
MFLHCNYHNNNYNIDSEQNDCRTYDDNGDLTFVNKYSIRTWSHDAFKKDNSYDNSEMFEKFVEVVNSQTKYNKDGKITSIPIVKYHKIDDITALLYYLCKTLDTTRIVITSTSKI